MLNNLPDGIVHISEPLNVAAARAGVREVCPGCGSDSLDLGPGSGPHPARIICSVCGKFIRWCGLPITPASAATFTMPFGRHKGTPMGELPRDYLAWLARTLTDRTGKRAAVLLREGGGG